MSDFRHLERPRTRPEMLGLSTLDTVTCALSGAIILMVVMASQTDPQAKVSLTAVQEIRESGDGTDGTSISLQTGQTAGVAAPGQVRNLAVIYFELKQGAEQISNVEVSSVDCQLTTRLTYEPSAHFPTDPRQRLVGVSIWADGAASSCSAFSVRVNDIGNESCQVTLVSGAHYESQDVRDCSSSIRFSSNNGSVFQFKGMY